MHDLGVKSIVVGRLDSLMMYMECLFKEFSNHKISLSQLTLFFLSFQLTAFCECSRYSR